MSFLEWIGFSKPQAAERPPDSDDYWYMPENFGAHLTDAGGGVGVDRAAQQTTVMGCVRVIARTFAMMPVHLYRQQGERREKDYTAPLYAVRAKKPNVWQSRFEFWELALASVLLRGNFYAKKVPGPRGAVDQLWPMDPDRMEVEQLSNRRLRYTFRDENGQPHQLSQDQVFHIRSEGDGITGESVITQHRRTIAKEIAQEEHGQQFFANRAWPGLVVTSEHGLDQAKVATIRQRVNAVTSGVNRHGTLVLGKGFSVDSLNVTNKDSEWLEGSKYTATQICSQIFLVPPHMIGLLDRATYSNIAEQEVHFKTHTMMGWTSRVEAAVARDLIVDEDLSVKFNADAVLRGDTTTRYGAYAIALEKGWMSPNEVRGLEDMNPIPGGDVYSIQLNKTPLGDEQADEPEPPEEDDQEEEDAEAVVKPNREAFAPLIEDAARRIAAAELRELEKRAKHAEKDRERFDAWAADFYWGTDGGKIADGHAAYIFKTLAPLARTMGVKAATLTEMARAITTAAVKSVQLVDDPAALVETWKQTRAADLAEQIAKELHDE